MCLGSLGSCPGRKGLGSGGECSRTAGAEALSTEPIGPKQSNHTPTLLLSSPMVHSAPLLGEACKQGLSPYTHQAAMGMLLSLSSSIPCHASGLRPGHNHSHGCKCWGDCIVAAGGKGKAAGAGGKEHRGEGGGVVSKSSPLIWVCSGAG